MSHWKPVTYCAVTGLLMLAMAAGATAQGRRGAPKAQPLGRKIDAVAAYGRLPLAFEANRGQTDPRVRFLARGPGYTLFLTSPALALGPRAPARALCKVSHVSAWGLPVIGSPRRSVVFFRPFPITKIGAGSRPLPASTISVQGATSCQA